MKKPYLKIILIISLVGFVIRLCIALQLYMTDPMVKNPLAVTDMATYMNLARQILQGSFYGAFDYQPFYYTVFLPAVYILPFNDVLSILIIQSVLSALTILFTAFACGILFGKRASIICAIFLCFSKLLIFYVPYCLIVTIHTFWISLIMYVSLLALKSKKSSLWAILGFITGCAILTRGNIWLLMPGLLLASVYAGIKQNSGKVCSKAFFPAILFSIFSICIQIPFIIHNCRVTGKFSLSSVAGPKVLALGNTPEAPPGGREAGSGPGPMEYPDTFIAWSNDKNQSLLSHIADWICEEPFAFAELTFRKLLLFWDFREIPNNVSLRVNAANAYLLRLFGIFNTWLFILLGLSGIFSLIIKKRKTLINKPPLLLIIYLLIAYWLATSAFYILARFRAPIIPVLACFSAFFISNGMNKLKRKEYASVINTFIFPFILSLIISFYAYDFYRTNIESYMVRFASPYGIYIKTQKSLFITDNGPLSFGGWRSIPCIPGLNIKKKFAIREKKIKSGFTNTFFVLYVLWKNAGKVILEINGVKREITSQNPGIRKHTFLVKNFDGKICIFVNDVTPGTAFFLLDTQRLYGRTFVNGSSVKCELVCRIIYEYK